MSRTKFTARPASCTTTRFFPSRLAAYIASSAAAERGLHRLRGALERDRPDARGDARQPRRERQAADEVHELERVARHRQARGLGQDDRELVAPQAGGNVSRPAVLADHAPDGLEHAVAGLVPGGVVHRLEPVEVDHEEPERAAIAPAAVDLPLERLVQVARVPEPRQPVAARRVALAQERQRERILRPEEPPDRGAPGAHRRGHARERRQPEAHVPGQRLRRDVSETAMPVADQLRGAPAGGGEADGRPATDGPEAPAGHRDDRHVDERQRDVGAGAAVEREDHAARGDEEADAQPAGEDRQARRAGVDRARGRGGAAAAAGGRRRRPIRPKPAEEP